MSLVRMVVTFFWRFTCNLICVFPVGQRLLFPLAKLGQRFGPGDADLLGKLQTLGFEILPHSREADSPLPIPRSGLARRFLSLPETEIRTTALDLVARKLSLPHLQVFPPQRRLNQ